MRRINNTILSCFLLFTSCFLFDKEEENTNLTLSLNSSTVTTVSLSIIPVETSASFSYQLTRDDSTILTSGYPLQPQILDTELTSNATYTYQVHWMEKNEILSSSNILSVQTQDSTIQLVITDIAKTNATLQITIPDSNLTWTTELYRNDSLVQTESSDSNIIIIQDWGLIPFTDYTYTVKRLEWSTHVSTSIPVSLTTEESSIQLTAIDTGVTSSMLHVQREGALPWIAHIERNDSIIDTFNLNTNDTLFRLGGMEPGTENVLGVYDFHDSLYTDYGFIDNIQTMDTTISNFYWDVDIIGPYNLSIANDGEVLHENFMTAYGMFTLTDNIDDDEQSLAWFDGNQWEYNFRLRLVLGRGSMIFSEDNVWIAAGGPYNWHGGDSITMYHLWDMGILDWWEDGLLNDVWGTDDNNLYFVGDSGTMVHYDGTNWTKIETNTNIKLREINGTKDGEHLIIVGLSSYYPHAATVLKKSLGEDVEEIFWTDTWTETGDTMGYSYGVAVIGDTAYIPNQNGLWKYNLYTDESKYISNSILNMWTYATLRVSATEINDIFYGSSSFGFQHFNGKSYTYFDPVRPTHPRSKCYGMDYKNGIGIQAGIFNPGQSVATTLAIVNRIYRIK